MSYNIDGNWRKWRLYRYKHDYIVCLNRLIAMQDLDKRLVFEYLSDTRGPTSHTKWLRVCSTIEYHGVSLSAVSCLWDPEAERALRDLRVCCVVSRGGAPATPDQRWCASSRQRGRSQRYEAASARPTHTHTQTPSRTCMRRTSCVLRIHWQLVVVWQTDGQVGQLSARLSIPIPRQSHSEIPSQSRANINKLSSDCHQSGPSSEERGHLSNTPCKLCIPRHFTHENHWFEKF